MNGNILKGNRSRLGRESFQINNQSKGFTLVELIVVLVILAILAAILVPVGYAYLDKAREKAELQKAAASLTATQSILNQVYNEGVGRLSPGKRTEAFRLAQAEGVELGTSFSIQPFKPLIDGTDRATKATEDYIASYTIQCAKYITSDGRVAFYDGRDWELFDSETDASSKSSKYTQFSANEGTIVIWGTDGVSPERDIAYDPDNRTMPEKHNNNDFADDINPNPLFIEVTLLGGEALSFTYLGQTKEQFSFTLSDALNLDELFGSLTINCNYQYDKDSCQWEENGNPVTTTLGLNAILDYLKENKMDLLAAENDITIAANVPTRKLTVPVNFLAYSTNTLTVSINGKTDYPTFNWIVDAKTGEVSAPIGFGFGGIVVTPAGNTNGMVSVVDGWFQKTSEDVYLTNTALSDADINSKIYSTAAALYETYNAAAGVNVSTAADPLTFVKQAEVTKKVYLTYSGSNAATFKMSETSDPSAIVSVDFVKKELGTEVRLKGGNAINSSNDFRALGTLNYNFMDSVWRLEINNGKIAKWWRAYDCESNGNRAADAICIGELRRNITDITSLVVNRLFYDESTKDVDYYARVEVNTNNSFALFKPMIALAAADKGGTNNDWAYKELGISRKNIKKFMKGTESQYNAMKASNPNAVKNLTAPEDDGDYPALKERYGEDGEEVFAWVENDVVYWYSEGEVAYINSQSHYPFTEWSAVTELNFQDIDFSGMVLFDEFFKGNVEMVRVCDDEGDYAIDTSSASGSMQSMFRKCWKLTSLDLSKMNTSKVTNMRQMFNETKVIKTLDLSSFDTSSLTSAYQMFSTASGVETIIFGEKAGFENTTQMYQMFTSCSNLKTVDFTSFKMSKLNSVNCQEMFKDCKNLTTIYVKDPDYNDGVGFYYKPGGKGTISNASNMFRGAVKLVGGNGTKYNTSKLSGDYAVVDKAGQLGYFTDETTYASALLLAGDNRDGSGSSLVSQIYCFGYGNNANISSINKISWSEFQNNIGETDLSKIYDSETKKGKTDGSSHSMYMNGSGSNSRIFVMYDGKINPYAMPVLAYTRKNSSNKYDAYYATPDDSYPKLQKGSYKQAFNQCTNCDFRNSGISNWDISAATDIGQMFGSCNNLYIGKDGRTDIDFSQWDFSSTENMRYFFSYCENVGAVNFSGSHFPSLTDARAVFYHCSSLTNVNFPVYSASRPAGKYVDIGYLCKGCTNLTSLNLGDDISQVKSFDEVLANCTSYTLDSFKNLVDNWDFDGAYVNFENEEDVNDGSNDGNYESCVSKDASNEILNNIQHISFSDMPRKAFTTSAGYTVTIGGNISGKHAHQRLNAKKE